MSKGSVYQRASDGRWIGAYVVGWTERGTVRRITVSADTRDAAKARLRQRIREIEDGANLSLNPRTTVKAWAEEWLPIAERTLRPNAYTASASALRKWIVPTIGHKRLDQLAPADVRLIDANQRAKGLKESSRKRTHSVAISLLKAARAEGHGVPLRVLEVPAPRTIEGSTRTEIPLDDATRLLRAAAEDPAGARWVAALLQGMRQGECLGLTRDQIDLERGVLILSWQLQPLPYRVKRDRTSGFRVPDSYESRQVRGRWHLVRPKSKAGWRVIPLVPWMSAALANWMEIMPESPHGLLWHYPVGDPPKRDDTAWYALQDRAGVSAPDGGHYTIHQARHTTATLLLEAKVDPAIITAIMGHSSIVSTRGYFHARTDMLLGALELVAERLALP